MCGCSATGKPNPSVARELENINFKKVRYIGGDGEVFLGSVTNHHYGRRYYGQVFNILEEDLTENDNRIELFD